VERIQAHPLDRLARVYHHQDVEDIGWRRRHRAGHRVINRRKPPVRKGRGLAADVKALAKPDRGSVKTYHADYKTLAKPVSSRNSIGT